MVRIASLTPELQKDAANLYREGKSASQVAAHFGVGIDAVYYALRRLAVQRRSAKETNSIRFEAKATSYRIQGNRTMEQERLLIAGICLYWAEGYKTNKANAIDFANADVDMVLIFRKFLTEICHIDEKRLKVLLYCYDTQRVDELIEFWSKKLHIPREQFTKPYVKQSIEGPQGHRMTHGLVHLRYSDKKLLRQLLAWIDEFRA